MGARVRGTVAKYSGGAGVGGWLEAQKRLAWNGKVPVVVLARLSAERSCSLVRSLNSGFLI